MVDLGGLLFSLLPQVVLYGGFTLTVWLLCRGRVRVLGAIGGLLLLLAGLLRPVVVQLVFVVFDLPSAVMGLVAPLLELPYWAGMVLIAVALVIGGRSLTGEAGPAEQPAARWGSDPAGPGPQHTPPPDPGHPSGR